jgi:hypothetical protein
VVFCATVGVDAGPFGFETSPKNRSRQRSELDASARAREWMVGVQKKDAESELSSFVWTCAAHSGPGVLDPDTEKTAMNEETRYTLWLERPDLDADDEVLGAGLTVQDAAKLVREYGGTKPRFDASEYAEFRSFEMIHFHSVKKYRSVIAATVPKSFEFAADERAAMRMIDEQIVHRHKELWPGRISTDAEFRSRLERVAERRGVQAIDREITTKLIDALIAAGYVITCCIRDYEPEFKRSVDRAGILDLLFDLDMAELHVHRNGKRSWIMLIFGEAGWDVVADYSVDLEELIEPVAEPYQSSAEDGDRGYSVIVLPSPGALERGDPSAEKSFEQFVQALEGLR